MQSSSDLEWDILGGSIEIDLENGLRTGLFVGYNWHHIFAEFQLSYQRNDIKGINQSLKVAGKIDGLGFYLSSGGRINFNEFFAGIVGVGVGGINQQLQFSLYNIVFEQKDFLFSSNIFLGVEFMPTEHLVLGLRYSWALIDEMDLFYSRYLNSAELTAGYLSWFSTG